MSCMLVVPCLMLECLAHAVIVLEMPIDCLMLVNVAHDAPEREHGSFVPQRHFMYLSNLCKMKNALRKYHDT